MKKFLVTYITDTNHHIRKLIALAVWLIIAALLHLNLFWFAVGWFGTDPFMYYIVDYRILNKRG